MIQLLQAMVDWCFAKILIRVVERQMDGCQASHMSREDYGSVIGFDRRLLTGHSDYKKVVYWLIRFDGDRKDEWYPACFFEYRDNDGAWVRSC